MMLWSDGVEVVSEMGSGPEPQWCTAVPSSGLALPSPGVWVFNQQLVDLCRYSVNFMPPSKLNSKKSS